MADVASPRTTPPGIPSSVHTATNRSPVLYFPTPMGSDGASQNQIQNNMQSSQGSYPSPSAIGIGDGTAPFFTSQQRLSPPDNLPQLSAQMLRHAPPMTTAPITPGQDIAPLSLPGNDSRLPTSPQQQQPQAPQSGMDPSHDSSFGDPTAPRKRSKVSRACDECRRKKVCFNALVLRHVLMRANLQRSAVTLPRSRALNNVQAVSARMSDVSSAEYQ
jgi:hypothetical protein